jgi:ABC-type Fe3+-hydroxamate transport system substrate-binding protein
VTVWRDDLGYPVELAGPARRVVSLVPSLTEAVAVSAPGLLVGATDWCTHPAGLAVTRVRGTKNPERAAIIALAPDLVIANREENRELDVTRLRDAGLAVWVTVIESVPEALASMRRLLTGPLALAGPDWLAAAERAWAGPGEGGWAGPVVRARAGRAARGPAAGPESVSSARPRVVVPIWRDPWMVVGARTFAGDLLARLGLVNAFGAGPERYPQVEVARIREARPDLVLLPDEPYPFTAADGPEEFPEGRVVLLPGRLLTWYGPSLATARADLESLIRAPG